MNIIQVVLQTYADHTCFCFMLLAEAAAKKAAAPLPVIVHVSWGGWVLAMAPLLTVEGTLVKPKLAKKKSWLVGGCFLVWYLYSNTVQLRSPVNPSRYNP